MHLITDANVRHDGDITRAHAMIDRVAEVATDSPIPVVFKGEVLWNPAICLDSDYAEHYWTREADGTWTKHTERFRDVIERKCASLDDHRRIFDRVRFHELPLMLSVYDAPGVDFCADYGAAVKIASSNIDNVPLCEYVRDAFDGEVYVDTSRASIGEVERVVRTLPAGRLHLAHVADGHPSPHEHHNMRSVETLRAAFPGCAGYGFSHHAPGDDWAALTMAVALGVDYIEVGIADRPGDADQDVAAAVALDDLGALCGHLGDAVTMLGAPWRDLAAAPPRLASSCRMGIVAAVDLRPSDEITPENIRTAFPADGISAGRWHDVVGQTVRYPCKAGAPLTWRHLL